MDIEIRKKQADRRDMMTSKFNCTHLIPSLNVLVSDDVVTAVIPAKERAVNDSLRMEAKIISTPHETSLDFNQSIVFRKTFISPKSFT